MTNKNFLLSKPDTRKSAIHQQFVLQFQFWISKFFVDTLIWFVRKSSQKESNNLEKVYQAVLAQTIYKGKSYTDIRSIQVSVRKTRELATVKAVKEILYQLQDMGLIDIDDQCSGTRRKLIFVNPLAVKKESERWKSLE